MNKKHTFKKVAALLLGVALTAGATGCSFITTNSQKDLEQIVATVNTSEDLAKDFSKVATDIKDLVKVLDTDILKRDLFSAYLSTGYQYVESYGYSYEDTFNMLLDNLINREIMLQYAIAYYLNKDSANINKTNYLTFKTTELGKITDSKVKDLLENDFEEVLLLKYFLTDGGKEDSMEDYDKAVYGLQYSLNNSLDSLEKSYITEEDDEHDHGETRTLPTGVDTQKEDYYTTDYKIYTGFEAANATFGEYEKQEGSTRTTRQKAYNAFLTNLHAYGLIDTDNSDGKVESTSDITKLSYYYMELASVLGQSLLNKYYDSLEEEVAKKLTADYLNGAYNDYFEQNQNSYQSDPTAFGSALDSASKDSFMTYGLADYGYVYNILIPFSASQNIEYTEAKNRGLSSDELYAKRRDILQDVTGTDLRGSWISEHDHANYSYVDGESVLFFEDNLKENPKYEELDHYLGIYPFNGTVEDGEVVSKNNVDIHEFIDIFEETINKAVGSNVIDVTKQAERYQAAYKVDESSFKKTDDKKKVDYSKFTMYIGKANFDDVPSPATYFDKTSQQYKALSAVNELMFAYSTDTGCLNKYMGYSVTPYTTSYVKEFEWAAQELIKNDALGVGSYAVCETDFGWHVLYCSFKYDENGTVYGNDVFSSDQAAFEAQIKAEGTFANLFYEYVKESAFTNHATEEQNRVLLKYSSTDSVTRFTKAYQDLLDMDN